MSHDQRYAACECGYAMVWEFSQRLRFTMACPRCGRADRFGPGAYTEDFNGFTGAEWARFRALGQLAAERAGGWERLRAINQRAVRAQGGEG